MSQRFIQCLRLDGFLSFAPGSEAFDLEPLNVLVGPNGAGKSNVIEAIELLRSTTSDFAGAVRDGGGPSEWLWKGERNPSPAKLDLEVAGCPAIQRTLRYRLEFGAAQHRVEVFDELIEEAMRSRH
jgi:predicted ATPase